MLICNNQLSTAELKALDNLASRCRAVDGDLPPLYTHILEQKRLTDNNFLYFHEDNLIGFLSIYFFYTNACEVSVMISPAHRRRGFAKQLIKAALPVLLAKQVDTLLFSTPAVVNEGWLTRLGLHYQNSEYHMERNSYEPILISKHALTIRKATEADIPALCAIDEQCFPVDPEDMPMRFINLMNDSIYSVMIALKGSKAVGKAHIRWQSEEAVLSDIAVMPEYQSRGFGSELLAYCINHALMLGKTKLALDVETSNHSALNLYTRHDFKSVNAIDFWAISTEKLCALLK
ncbi:ribosomal-protein-alanine N-acetyltransferase [Legionella massiliensis]|uniref:Ribosomal-protein-alanine N-acetyltransferase n=1 Tax=Legionella massiliensis TaxID=1034943 RepID=A0A078KX55_9GAMM|nr:GNAT family N-acetyltransferase [Legionella massiliensis]CDZ76283.1 ribosomal-protein-alanine N-acetyltransferase [Legionella massiliensis]CEE12021.1 Mycothiol acetyltransferase [Legionella massiliensis]